MGFITVFKFTADPTSPLGPIPGPTAPPSAFGVPLRPTDGDRVWGGERGQYEASCADTRVHGFIIRSDHRVQRETLSLQ